MSNILTNSDLLLSQNNLAHSLIQVSLRELFYFESAPCSVYAQDEGLFTVAIKDNTPINNDLIKSFLQRNKIHFFVDSHDYQKIVERSQKLLMQQTRSLSIGDQIENGKKEMNVLSLNLRHLYNDPINDELLSQHAQGVKILAYFLMENLKNHFVFFEEYKKNKHHYILAQPMLSSLFLIGLIKHAKIYSDKESENLFMASYFKDIGMSIIPFNKFQEKDLNEHDKILMNKHAKYSVRILASRLKLNSNYFKIIEEHHVFSSLNRNRSDDDFYANKQPERIIGIETLFVAITDIIAAMISERPYRNATTLFEALDLVKILISERYPQEFKLLVSYFKIFFK